MPISKPIWNLNGTWARLHTAERLRRSSHVLSVINNTAYIFGGEIQPRQPVDAQLDILPLYSDASSPAKLSTNPLSPAPTPRVGTAATSLASTLYLFSGRGGPSMSPLDDHGALWSFSPTPIPTWSLVSPASPAQPYPPARSYHCAASDGTRTLFIHAGCPAAGRLSDLWMFDVHTRTWVRGADAPGAPRGGASIAYSGGKVYRMGGFDGVAEQGGSVDVYDVAGDSWTSEAFVADGRRGPGARSVGALLSVRIQGREKLVTLFGERDPSALGHAGAGKMLGDVWIYDIAEKWWTKVEPWGNEGVPDARGWFGADVVRGEEGENDGILVHGGLGEDNERLTDVWLLSF